MSAAECSRCLRELQEGETAWASDWRVLDVCGTSAIWCTETRYTCDACEEALRDEAAS